MHIYRIQNNKGWQKYIESRDELGVKDGAYSSDTGECINILKITSEAALVEEVGHRIFSAFRNVALATEGEWPLALAALLAELSPSMDIEQANEYISYYFGYRR